MKVEENLKEWNKASNNSKAGNKETENKGGGGGKMGNPKVFLVVPG
jgi:hypothetical protein